MFIRHTLLCIISCRLQMCLYGDELYHAQVKIKFILCYVMLCYVMLCYVMLCYVNSLVGNYRHEQLLQCTPIIDYLHKYSWLKGGGGVGGCGISHQSKVALSFSA